jgi:hypothetical protein
MPNMVFEKIDPSDRAISAWQHLGKGEATPENRVVLRFRTASVDICRASSERMHSNTAVYPLRTERVGTSFEPPA